MEGIGLEGWGGNKGKEEGGRDGEELRGSEKL